MPNVKRVMDYSRLNFNEVLELPCDVFKLMIRNSIIDELSKTEEGREYLQKCERLKQTKPDIAELRKRMLGGE